jgi:hypothetical protein
MNKAIANEWAKFQAAVMPPDAPIIQRREMRRAFYAGVWAMLSLASAIADEFDEPTGAAQLDAISEECKTFTAQIGTMAEDLSL